MVKVLHRNRTYIARRKKVLSINFTDHDKKLCWNLHYNGGDSYLFVNGKEIHKFKAKDSEIEVTSLCLGNVLKECSVDNKKKAGLNGYVFDPSVDYDAM